MSEQEITPRSGSGVPKSMPEEPTDSRRFGNPLARVSVRFTDLLPTLWRWLCGPRWIWIILASAALLGAAALWLPQLPADLVDNSTLATRWLIRTSSDFAWGGEILRVLGLFDVVHSPLLRVVLIVVGVLSAVQLAERIGFAWALYHTDSLPQRPVTEPGQAVPLNVPVPLYRLRTLHPFPADESAAQVNTFVREHYARFSHSTYQLPTRLPVDSPPASPPNGSDVAPPTEERMLARHHEQAALVRPLFLVGQLLLVVFIGMVTIYGWSFTVLNLGPGEASVYSAQQLEVRYGLPPAISNGATERGESSIGAADNTAGIPVQRPVQLEVQVGERAETIDANQHWFARVGGIYVRARYGDPGLLVRTVDESPLLLVPNGGARSSHVGLVFPDAGSEAFIVLPQQAIALRVLRVIENEQSFFLVEIFDDFDTTVGENVSSPSVQPSDMQPSNRLAVYDWQRIELADGAIALEFMSLPGLNVRAVSLPGLWLSIPALLCLLIGALSLRHNPSFLLTQVVPWMDQSVVIVQSSTRAGRDRLASWLLTNRQDENSATNAAITVKKGVEKEVEKEQT